MRAISFLIGLMLFAIGIGATWLLFKIGGKSDGPGALFVYLAAFGGLGIGGYLLKS